MVKKAAYKDKQPIAYAPITGLNPVVVLDIIHGIDDLLVWKWADMEQLHTSKIRISGKGAFVEINRIRVYMDQFVRM